MTLALLVVRCGPWKSGTEPTLNEEMRVSDLVKLISPDITNGADEKTFDQTRYPIGPNHRVLIMYSDLVAHLEKINTNDGGKVLLELNLSKVSDTEAALDNFKICPLIEKWMLLATWERAFPRRKWSSAGGDFDPSGCISPTPTKPTVALVSKKKSQDQEGEKQSSAPMASPTPTPAPTYTGTLYFDITDWYLNYPKGRGINYGLILTSQVDTEILGDRSGAGAPRIYWYELSSASSRGHN